MIQTEKIFSSQDLKSLPAFVSLMPPCIVNGEKRFAVYSGTTGKWIRIDENVTLEDVRVIWQKWEPVKTEEQKQLETLKSQSWEILASNKKSTYTVKLIAGMFSCSCVGFGFYKKCKHIEEAKKNLDAKI